MESLILLKNDRELCGSYVVIVLWIEEKWRSQVADVAVICAIGSQNVKMVDGRDYVQESQASACYP